MNTHRIINLSNIFKELYKDESYLLLYPLHIFYNPKTNKIVLRISFFYSLKHEIYLGIL